MELTAETISLVLHIMEEMLENQDDIIRRTHIDMVCTVLRETLEENLLQP